MHPLIWFLILFPPCLAYWIWRGIAYKTGDTGATLDSSFGLSGKRVRLGRHSYWILLAICYAAFFGAAFALHKL